MKFNSTHHVKSVNVANLQNFKKKREEAKQNKDITNLQINN